MFCDSNHIQVECWSNLTFGVSLEVKQNVSLVGSLEVVNGWRKGPVNDATLVQVSLPCHRRRRPCHPFRCSHWDPCARVVVHTRTKSVLNAEKVSLANIRSFVSGWFHPHHQMRIRTISYCDRILWLRHLQNIARKAHEPSWTDRLFVSKRSYMNANSSVDVVIRGTN